MKFNDMTIGTKISGSFLLILFLLLMVSGTGIFGFGKIVKNATEVIEGNKLDGILAQKEVDHLVWVNKVNALLTDENITTLNIQTDDHKCGFGEWLYGQSRKEAENRVPELINPLKTIEKPHLLLHESAVDIAMHFKPVDANLGEFLSQKKIDHLLWTHQIKDALLNRTAELNIQLDPTQCGLGKWILSQKTIELKQRDKAFSKILDDMIPQHKALHESARSIEALLKESQFEQAHAFYLENTMVHAGETLEKLDQAISWHHEKIKGVETANKIYAERTLPALAEIQLLLKDIRKTARGNIMGDQVMLAAAQNSKTVVVSLSIGVFFLGILFSFLTTRGLNKVLKTITTGLGESAGQVAHAAREISVSSQSLAQNASEQAATVEETSASVQQITASSRQTDQMTHGAETLMNENIEKSGQSLKASWKVQP